MKAKTIKGKSTGEIQSALQQCLADGYRPTLAFVVWCHDKRRNRTGKRCMECPSYRFFHLRRIWKIEKGTTRIPQ